MDMWSWGDMDMWRCVDDDVEMWRWKCGCGDVKM